MKLPFRFRKAQVAIPFAMAWIFFNLIVNIMIYSFGQDSIVIGTPGSNAVSINGSTTSDIDVPTGTGFISSYRAGLSGMPWWVTLIYGMVDLSFLALIVYALIRGL